MECFVLAGGASRRMGRPKSDLTLGGRTFLERAVMTAFAVSTEVSIVVRPDAPAVPSVCPVLVESPHEGSGPIFGVLAALRQARGESCLIIAVDYPLITAQLLAFVGASLGDAKVACPLWGGRPQSLCAAYRSDQIDALEGWVASGNRSITAWVESVSRVLLPEDLIQERFGADVLWNVNRPRDYDALLEKHGS